MKTIKLLAISFAAILAFSACTKDSNDGVENIGGQTTLTISVKDIATRTSDHGTESERALTNLEFYIFNGQGGLDGTTSYFNTSETGKSKYIFQVDDTNQTLTVAVVANSSLGQVSNYEELKGKLAKVIFNIEQDSHNSRLIPQTGFEMFGENQVLISAGAENNSVNVALDRLVTKINKPAFDTTASDFINLSDIDLKNIWGNNTTISNSDIEFVFDGYAVINGLDKSSVYFSDWANWKRDNKDNLISEFDDNGEYTNNYSGKQGSDWFLSANEDEEPVYVYESAPATLNNDQGTGFSPNSVYSFIVKGTLKDTRATNAEANAVRYWRINILKENEYNIERNKSIKVTVNSIKTGGHATPEDAETNDPIIPIPGNTYINVTITVNPWTVVESTTEM